MWEEVVTLFMRYQEAKGCSPRTLEDYRVHLGMFYRTTKPEWNDVDLRRAALEYFAASKDMKPSAYNTRLRKLRCFFTWAIGEGMLKEHPCRGIKQRKEDPIPRSASISDVKKLLDVIDRSTYIGKRDYALILLMMDTGIRPQEALSLLPKDFHLMTGSIVIPAEVAKTRVSRRLPLSYPTIDAIKKLLAARPETWGDDAPIFATHDGNHFNRYLWGVRLKKYSQMAKVKVTPYQLRHTFASYYLRNGGNLFTLQKTLGHADLRMTRRYTKLLDEDLVEAHRIASPLNVLVKPKKKRAK